MRFRSSALAAARPRSCCGLRPHSSLNNLIWLGRGHQFKLAALMQSRWYEYLLRFGLGGLVTVLAGAVAQAFGPETGGLFLAFPCIFCASTTLIEKHERERKKGLGLLGFRRGTDAAALDAAGAGRGACSRGIRLRRLAACAGRAARIAEPRPRNLYRLTLFAPCPILDARQLVDTMKKVLLATVAILAFAAPSFALNRQNGRSSTAISRFLVLPGSRYRDDEMSNRR